jgi:hypothetical protein
MRQFAQRIAVEHHLQPLDAQETREYIQHRLQVAGGDPDLFDVQACTSVYAWSRGTPGLINLLCDTVLQYGYEEQRPVVDGALVSEILNDRAAGQLLALADVEEPAVQERGAPVRDTDDPRDRVEIGAYDGPVSGASGTRSKHPDAREVQERKTLDDILETLPEWLDSIPKPPTRPTRQPPEPQATEVLDEPTRPTQQPPEPQATEMLDEPTLPRLDDPPRRPIDAWGDEPETRAPRRGALAMAIVLFVAAFALTYLALNWYWDDLPGVVTRQKAPLPTQTLEMLRPRTASQESAPPSSARPEQTQAKVADDTSATGTVPTTPQERVPAVPENWTRIGPETGAAPPPSPVKEGVTPPADVPSDQAGAVVSESTAESDLAPSHKAPVRSTQSAAKKGPDAGANRVGNRSVIRRGLEGGLRRQGFKTGLMSHGQLKVTLHREVPFRSGTAKLDRTAIQHLDKLAFVRCRIDHKTHHGHHGE